MIYFFHGSDKSRSLAKARELTDGLLAKRPGALVFRVAVDPWDSGRFSELLVSGGLFAPAHVVVMNGALAVSAAAAEAMASLEEMRGSGNVFVWVEGEVDDAKLAPIAAAAAKVTESRGASRSSAPIETNRFALADAIVGRDKKQAWKLLVEALADAAPEEVHGIVWWGVKSALLASRAATPEESGQKPFVHSKFKRMAAKWPEGELEKFGARLVDIYHRAHEGRGDLGRGMERAVLENV